MHTPKYKKILDEKPKNSRMISPLDYEGFSAADTQDDTSIVILATINSSRNIQQATATDSSKTVEDTESIMVRQREAISSRNIKQSQTPISHVSDHLVPTVQEKEQEMDSLQIAKNNC